MIETQERLVDDELPDVAEAGRTFAWLGRFRRLARDYEYLPATSENAIYLAMSVILLRRMARPARGRAAGPGGSGRSRAGAAAH